MYLSFGRKEDSKKAQLAKVLRLFRKDTAEDIATNQITSGSQLADLELKLGGDTFLGDGMLLWGREIGWLRDERLVRAMNHSEPKRVDDLLIAWRTHIVTWAASIVRNAKGDFFEFGC